MPALYGLCGFCVADRKVYSIKLKRFLNSEVSTSLVSSQLGYLVMDGKSKDSIKEIEIYCK